jgi:DNA-directed RNA polymerase specialized sigma24 family protein
VTREPSSEEARARAIERLPTPYAVALRLRDAGTPDDVIAEALGIDLLSLPSLLGLAEAKLATIERRLEPGEQHE